MNLKTRFVLLFALLLMVSCDKKRVFDQYVSFGDTWPKDSIASFTFNNPDTIKAYDLYLNLRSNDDYSFNNIFMIVAIETPGGFTNVDTLQYKMTNPDGTLLGDGFTDVKESKLYFKENYKFKKLGDHKISISQAVRKTGSNDGEKELDGITEIGFRIEKRD